MSNLHGSLLKGGSGKVGRIIQSSWKGIDYIRIMPDHVSNPRTYRQQSHRMKFRAVTGLAKKVFRPLIKEIWNPISKHNMGFNKFTQANIHAFSEDGSINNYEQLQFSQGELPIAGNLYVKADGKDRSKIFIHWSYNPETEINNAYDNLNLVAIEEDNYSYNLRIINNISFIRKQEKALIDLPFKGNSTIHLYPYFKGIDGTSYSHNSYVNVKPII